ncbi:hypothetical protein [Sinorhizobium saheli]|uniref:hypothetical protein n=1 Tax=Sinorhizobium saheli TaxID=36856 RepID=UPI0012958A36|nr:hypothetical protein [Sinorhizobium saheli]MQW86009.1 hypothetical protein [Sinorhizobium saheli]
MKFKLAHYAAALALAAITTGPSAANEDADRAILQRKVEAYAQDIYAQYPAKKAYLMNNKTPRGQGAVDEVYAVIRKNGGDSIAYADFNQGDNLLTQDYPSVEQADVVFCGCTAAEAKAMKAAMEKQGFKGPFVHLVLPQ